MNARGVHVSSAHVALTEIFLYALCIGLQLQRMPLAAVALAACVFSWLVFTWLMRQGIDPKGLRDLLIPILFVGLGMQNRSVNFAEKVLKIIVGIVVVMGLFESVFFDVYGLIFNTLSFYGNIGGVRESAAMYGGQTLTLNGFRPEGIGRTLLPSLLGAHRTSSAMMEPVSLGNLGVILLAWGLSKPWRSIQKAPVVILSAALLIVLADSRFGMVMACVFFLARLAPVQVIKRCAPTFPLMILACVLAITLRASAMGDDLLGRVGQSGAALLEFSPRMLLGLQGPLPGFGDMGFAYVISRFGIPLCLLLLLAIFMVPMRSERAQRFRAFVVLYIFSNLAVSGTSVFALKTAGLMWFLFGVLSMAHPQEQEAVQLEREPDQDFHRLHTRWVGSSGSSL
jgi:putative polymerase